MIRVSALLSGLLVPLFATACDAGAPVSHSDATVPTPTWAPPAATPAAGSVFAAGAGPSSVAVEVGGQRMAVGLQDALVVLRDDGTRVASVPVDAPVLAVVALPGGGFRALSGTAVLTLPPLPAAASSAPGGSWPGLTRWLLPAAGSALAVPPTGDWTAVTVPSRGEVIIVSATGTAARTIKAGGRPSAIAADATRIAVVDATQSSLTVFDPATGAKQEALRAGDGAATVTADGTGRFVVVDARDGELLVFETGPLVLRQRHPVPGTPYGAAYDPARRTLWVAVTQRNEVAGYDLSGGAPREIARHPAVRLPVLLAVDPRTGTVVVAGSADGLVQRISP